MRQGGPWAPGKRRSPDAPAEPPLLSRLRPAGHLQPPLSVPQAQRDVLREPRAFPPPFRCAAASSRRGALPRSGEPPRAGPGRGGPSRAPILRGARSTARRSRAPHPAGWAGGSRLSLPKGPAPRPPQADRARGPLPLPPTDSWDRVPVPPGEALPAGSGLCPLPAHTPEGIAAWGHPGPAGRGREPGPASELQARGPGPGGPWGLTDRLFEDEAVRSLAAPTRGPRARSLGTKPPLWGQWLVCCRQGQRTPSGRGLPSQQGPGCQASGGKRGEPAVWLSPDP